MQIRVSYDTGEECSERPQDRVHHAEDGAGSRDAEREHQEGDGGEAPVPRQPAQPIAHVLPQTARRRAPMPVPWPLRNRPTGA
jgi:hypothetical protein